MPWSLPSELAQQSPLVSAWLIDPMPQIRGSMALALARVGSSLAQAVTKGWCQRLEF